MNSSVKLFCKSFCIYSFVYGSITLVLHLIFSDFDWESWLLGMLGFGLFLSGISIWSHLYSIKKHRKKVSPTEDLRGVYSNKLQSHLNVSELKEKMQKDAVFGSSKFTDCENGFIINTGYNFMESWGEIIHIKLVGKEENTYEYLVYSEPKWKFVLFSFDKNLQNIAWIERLILKPSTA